MFSGLSPGVYTLRVVATNRKPDKVFITRRFEITDDPGRCTLHLINEGVSVRGDSVRVEFSEKGPASDYLCSLDKTQPYQCMCLTVSLFFWVIWFPSPSPSLSLFLCLCVCPDCRFQSSGGEWIESRETCSEGSPHWLWQKQNEPQY